MKTKPSIKKIKTHPFLRPADIKGLILFNALVAVVYFIILAFLFERSSTLMYWILILGAIFFLWQALTFLYTVWDTGYRHKRDKNFKPWVDVFITVAGEPLDVIEQTVKAVKAMRYPNFKVHILNDGFVANKDNWKDVEFLAGKIGVSCITRRKPGGAKAGNINNALRMTNNPFVAIFDADHVPHEDRVIDDQDFFAHGRLPPSGMIDVNTLE
jgi:cellulose synthase (UDP-forming)